MSCLRGSSPSGLLQPGSQAPIDSFKPSLSVTAVGEGGEESDTLGKEGGRDMSGTQKQHAKRRLWFRGVSREKVRKSQGAGGRG